MKTYEVLVIEFATDEFCGMEYYEDITAENVIAAFANTCNGNNGDYRCWLFDNETDEELCTFIVNDNGTVDINWA